MTRLKRTTTVFAAVAAAAFSFDASTAMGQGIVTDRPDFTESAVTVPTGVLQFEAGATYSSLPGDFSELVLGETLLRWGVSGQVEVRVGGPSFVSVSNGETHSGLGDGSLGAKIQLGPIWGGWDLAVIGSASMPLGDDDFSSGKVDPTIILTTGRALDERFSVGGQAVASWPTLGDSREFEWGGTLVVSSALGAQTGAFVELAATVPEVGSAPIVGHAGLVYAVSDSFQLDLHAGVGLTDTAPEAFLGIGLSGKL